GQKCDGLAESVARFVESSRETTTVVLSFFGYYLSGEVVAAEHRALTTIPPLVRGRSQTTDPRGAFADGLERTVDRFEAAGKTVVIISDNPALPFLPRDCLRAELTRRPSACSVTKSVVIEKQKVTRAVIADILRTHPRVRSFDA